MSELTVMQKQEMARGAQAMGSIMGRYAKRKSDKLTSPLGTLSFWGRVLSVTAVTVAMTCIGLAALDASRMNVDRSQKAVVARDTVNLRQSPSTGGTLLAKVHSGDHFDIVGSKSGWTKVKTADGKLTGWISSVLLDTRTVKTFVMRYEMKGYFTAFLIALAVAFFALRMKRAGSPQTARNPNETMLIEEKG
jgi:hypothetical protein